CVGRCVVTSAVSSATCSTALSAAEPDQATVNCMCATPTSSIPTSAFDQANFMCLTPGLMVTKDCATTDANGDNPITITIKNTGSADLENCTVSDTNFTDAGCPVSGNPTGASSTVMVSPGTIASL